MSTDTTTGGHTGPTINSYTLEDEFGHHEIVLEHGSKLVNEQLINLFERGKWFPNIFRWVHGDITLTSVDPRRIEALLTTDTGDEVFGPKRMAIVCEHDEGSHIIHTYKDQYDLSQQEISIMLSANAVYLISHEEHQLLNRVGE